MSSASRAIVAAQTITLRFIEDTLDAAYAEKEAICKANPASPCDFHEQCHGYCALGTLQDHYDGRVGRRTGDDLG